MRSSIAISGTSERNTMLTNADLKELIEFRRDLHRHPELSGEEVETAGRIADALRDLSP